MVTMMSPSYRQLSQHLPAEHLTRPSSGLFEHYHWHGRGRSRTCSAVVKADNVRLIWLA